MEDDEHCPQVGTEKITPESLSQVQFRLSKMQSKEQKRQSRLITRGEAPHPPRVGQIGHTPLPTIQSDIVLNKNHTLPHPRKTAPEGSKFNTVGRKKDKKKKKKEKDGKRSEYIWDTFRETAEARFLNI